MVAMTRCRAPNSGSHPTGWPSGPADALLAALRERIPWETHRIRLFGREVDSPRLSCWIGDEGAAYTYSGARFEPRPGRRRCSPVRAAARRRTGGEFNSVLANLYRDGRDCMGWHSDNESALGPQPVIASLSLGATRRFVLKHRAGAVAKAGAGTAARQPAGDGGDTQRNYRHALPRTARPVGERINLTFRRIVA